MGDLDDVEDMDDMDDTDDTDSVPTAGPEDDLLAPYARVDRRPRPGLPWVMANMVGGLDGSAAVGGRVSVLSTSPDAALFSALRSLADVVLVGAGTVRREGYAPITLRPDQASARAASGRRPNPQLAVVTRTLDLDWTGRVFAEAPPDNRTIVLTCATADPTRLRLAAEVAEVVVAGEDRVDPAGAVRQLQGRGLDVVLCEGGPTWLGELVAADLLDELCLTIAPVMGGDPLPVSVSPPGAEVRAFALRHAFSREDTVFLRYERAGA